MKLSEFDYDLPTELIAQTPVEPRDASRLLVYERAGGTIAHRHFRDIGEYLSAGDVLVFNRTRVIPARLYGRKDVTGGAVEVVGRGVMTVNGHCSYLPGNEWILNDTYPDRDRLQHVYRQAALAEGLAQSAALDHRLLTHSAAPRPGSSAQPAGRGRLSR